ncbi:class I SAM-dependent methyltransferase [uncultured Thiodictyon sp.]|uniref:class I SAM-dependent methyltransferase n=1 Tax=uncultured Thiodictyon sp. TaxID=1846217 RepID=UPI0025DE9F52|nr:class I SAM-dependent methyltransferase [uncultured Thiodictyon sp.]
MQIQDFTPPLAHTADRHHLYERAVQSPRAEVDFIDQTYRKLRGRSARWLREDFCGTAAVGCEWVRRRPTNRAVGVDRDPEVLDWAQRNNLATLSADQRARIQLLEQDVATPASRPLDLVLALNFSYWLLTDRAALRAYFAQVRTALAPDGAFLLDAYGAMTPTASSSRSGRWRTRSLGASAMSGSRHCTTR